MLSGQAIYVLGPLPLTIAELLGNPEVRVPLRNQLWLSRI